MATKKISDFTPSSAPGLHWLIPFGETDLTNFAVRYDDFQKYFGQDDAILSVGNYNPDTSTIFNVYSSDRGFVADTKYFSISGVNTGVVYSRDRLNLHSSNVYITGNNVFMDTNLGTISGKALVYRGNFGQTSLTGTSYVISLEGDHSLSVRDSTDSVSNKYNHLKQGGEYKINSQFDNLLIPHVETFRLNHTGVSIAPAKTFSVNLTGLNSQIDFSATGFLLTSANFLLNGGGNTMNLDSVGLVVDLSQIEGTVDSWSMDGLSYSMAFNSMATFTAQVDEKTAKAFRFIGNTGWGANIPLYFEANNNAYSDAFYFYSESGKFRTATNNLGLKAFSNAEISGGNLYLQGGYFNVTNNQSLFNIAGYGNNINASITIDSDGICIVDSSSLFLNQGGLTSFTAGSNTFTSNSFAVFATGNQLSLSDGTGYVVRVTGDSFIDSDKAAITFATNGADTAHFSSDATLWLNKSTGFFNNSGSYNFTTLLRTGDFYMDSLKFAFVGASGAATNFAIDLTIREYSGVASKIIANTGALRMNGSDFIKHTSLDGRDYLETELDVGVVLKGGTYSYDIFTTIATGNSVPWTGRLGINGQFIKKSYTDFLTGGT